MDTTIRNLDPVLYRRARARAATEGKTVGAVINEALRQHLRPQSRTDAKPHWWDVPVENWGPGTENLSNEVEDILYGEDQ
ncbi:MAG TPA: hypothetical protein VN515_05165 [Terriglobales bacterium]|nr:hypothetical protein [Terriglobales bacterium]